MTFSAASLHAVLSTYVPAEARGIVVGLSGGADSAALLAAIAAQGFRGLPLRAVHIDHGLQAAAAQFLAACETLCRHCDVPLKIIRVAVERLGVSLEAAARDARYAALAAELQNQECLVTAHHREDQAETLLLQALRGAGPKGLSAMPVCKALGAGWHVRPLLDVTQSELLAFDPQLTDTASQDPMNKDLRFDRSYLRQQIWPLLTQRWPGAAVALSRTARHMAQAQQLLNSSAQADLTHLRDGDALLVTGLRSLSALRRVNVVRLWLDAAGVEPPSTARLQETLRQVLAAEEDQLPAVVWGDHALRRYRQRLFLTAAQPPCIGESRAWAALHGEQLDLGESLGTLTVEPLPGGLDLEGLPHTLTLRRRAGGETLKPAPLAKTQSVQHLCQSLGVLPWMRDALPLVFAGNELIAVADLWLAARSCVSGRAAGFGIVWNKAPIIV
jgi:tRNA(Ile)-lysidine synthase